MSVKAGLVAYSQGAPEVIMRMDKASARALRAFLDKHAFVGPDLVPDAVCEALDNLQALNLDERPRAG